MAKRKRKTRVKPFKDDGYDLGEETPKQGRTIPPNFAKHQIKKGQILNPLGAKAHDPVMRKIRRLTNAELAEVGSMVLDNDLEGLRAIGKDSKSSALKVWIAAVAVKGITTGNMDALDKLLTRIVGKPKERIELTGKNGKPVQTQSQIMIALMKDPESFETLNKLDKLASGIKSEGEDTAI